MKILNNTAKLLLIFFLTACTDLEVVEKDSYVSESQDGFAGAPADALLDAGYNGLQDLNDHENAWGLIEVTSDEMVVPTRGSDWGDNGVWRTMQQHQWSPTHVRILNTWNNLNRNIYGINQLLSEPTLQNFGRTDVQTAEGKFLRAVFMFYVLDFFGQIPFREVDEGVDVAPRVLKSKEATDFIITDLEEALPDLESIPPSENTNRASKAAAHFMLAKIYLNKFVYYDEATPQAADMNKVIEHVDAIKAQQYELHDGFFDIFRPTVDSETILWSNRNTDNKLWNTLHYSQANYLSPSGGWNGFSTTAEFYALFEGDPETNAPGSGQEERRGYVPTDGEGYGMLFGQQYNVEGEALKNRQGEPLFFTKEFEGIVGNGENNGIRVLKYHPSDGTNSHTILFRYADAHLMKIEAILRGGTSGDDALALYNELRTIRDASTAASIALEDILDERGRELYIEGWRRNDQIRFGTYTDTWTLKENTEEFRVLFPIPADAVASNPNLEQNPGY